MLSPAEKQEKIIRSTDLDALSCRFSANNKSYFAPPDPYIDVLIKSYRSYLHYCAGYSNLSANRTLKSSFGEKKMPLINRGTYFRTKLINLIIDEFIQEFGKCQIISLGGGSDTRCFHYLANSNVTYHEIDFPESAKIKLLAIFGNASLKEIVQYNEDRDRDFEINSKEDFENYESELHTNNYHLYGMDLRQLKDFSIGEAKFLPYVNTSLPTLILSECALCYVSPLENEQIVKFWNNFFQKSNCVLAFLTYEPMSLDDPFGVTMKDNLSKRGINLLTFNEFPTLQSRCDFLFSVCHLKNIRLTDMCDIGGYGNESPWIDNEELLRINKLELIDEVEEIRLLLKHYCICYGEMSRSNVKRFKGIDNWRWLIKRDT
ncbi:uncharacterized protein PRCAT00002180001 [Priceomyces carsonii]|uniref:uncharacterized protein n=1 Tax=Priceomyces carsonii TaxID=28549 RepID=UPI002ED77679|nr:unnamed protein product [Priceomyces carsonii]